MLVEHPSVCVLASKVDNWLLCSLGGFAFYSLEHRGCWLLLPAVPFPGNCSDGILAFISFRSYSYACLLCMLLVVEVCFPLFCIRVSSVEYVLRRLREDCLFSISCCQNYLESKSRCLSFY